MMLLTPAGSNSRKVRHQSGKRRDRHNVTTQWGAASEQLSCAVVFVFDGNPPFLLQAQRCYYSDDMLQGFDVA